MVKNPPARNIRDTGSIPGSGRDPWRRAWQSTLVFLPGESHRGAWRTIVHRVAESYMTEVT